jgi:hypothetical protein
LANLLLVLGNGFTIDFVNQIGKEEDIDVKNLFRLGHTVKIPDTKTFGFLSHKYCPNLWMLGARPNIKHDEGMAIIEEIITCSNMLFDYLNHSESENERIKLLEKDNQSVFIKAYSELTAYLRHLFISYNAKITVDQLSEFLLSTSWGWRNLLSNAQNKYDRIHVITYSYDIWLERILKELRIDYQICGCGEDESFVNIVKPHGSISFVPHSGKNLMYEINYTIDMSGTDMDHIAVEYDELDSYDKSYLIPPAGDSPRQEQNAWSKRLRECAVAAVKSLGDNDDAIICGMSYWHVDRKELDELLINMNQNVNLTIINPSLPRELNAVLVTLFKNYTTLSSSDLLREVI